MDRTLRIYQKNNLLLADFIISYDETAQAKHRFTSYMPAPQDDDPLNELNIVVPFRHYIFEVPYVAFESMDALMKADRDMAAGVLKDNLSDCNFVYDPQDKTSRHLISNEGNVLGIATLHENFTENKKTMSFFSASKVEGDGMLISGNLESNYALLQRTTKAVIDGNLLPVGKNKLVLLDHKF